MIDPRTTTDITALRLLGLVVVIAVLLPSGGVL
jgi:hypothetical protein